MNEKETSEPKSKKKESKTKETLDKTDQSKTSSTANIYFKLRQVQSKIKELVRTEENTGQHYWFFEELQVLRLLKPLLEKHELVILLSDDENKGFTYEMVGKVYVVHYWKKVEIFNTESPEEKLVYYFAAIGQNNDPAKAKGSAETYATKYFLSKLFLIPVKDKQDPDYGSEEVEPVSKPTPPKTTTLNQVDALMNFLVQKRGNSKEIQTNFLKEVDRLMPKYKIVGETAPGNLRGRVSLLKDEDYQTLWNWLEKLPDSK